MAPAAAPLTAIAPHAIAPYPQPLEGVGEGPQLPHDGHETLQLPVELLHPV